MQKQQIHRIGDEFNATIRKGNNPEIRLPGLAIGGYFFMVRFQGSGTRGPRFHYQSESEI